MRRAVQSRCVQTIPDHRCLARCKAVQRSRSCTRWASTGTHSSSTQEYCVIVDENNQVVGSEPRDVTVRNRLLGRGSYVLVSNLQGELLVSKRSSTKDVYPSHWDVVISGVVRAGEEYEDTAARELAEEIGVTEAEAREGLRRLFVFPYRDASCHVWGCAFAFTHPGGELQLQKEEVDWAGFRSMEQVSSMLVEERFTPVGQNVLELYRQQQGAAGRGGEWEQGGAGRDGEVRGSEAGRSGAAGGAADAATAEPMTVRSAKRGLGAGKRATGAAAGGAAAAAAGPMT